jgi:hypothetical protein
VYMCGWWGGDFVKEKNENFTLPLTDFDSEV